MAKKQTAHSTRDNASDAELAQNLRMAAQHIWLAGLSALARTQEESAKVFGALKSEGRHTSRSARSRITGLTGDVGRAATQATRGASGALERLEQLFDTRIARTLEHLGVPTTKEMRAIADRLDALESRNGAAPRKRSSKARAPAQAGGVKTVSRKTGAKASTRRPAKKRTSGSRVAAGIQRL